MHIRDKVDHSRIIASRTILDFHVYKDTRTRTCSKFVD